MKKQRSGPSGYFPDDCWELVFQKLREDDERDLDSISLVSKRFLSLSNRVKDCFHVYDEAIPLLPNLLRRFRQIETIVLNTYAPKDIDGLVDQISRYGVSNLQAITFSGFTEPPRDGFKALALNKNIKNNLKVLDCSRLISMQDKDLVLIADLFPCLEELRITGMLNWYNSNDKVATQYITDDGVDALASKLKELKKVVIKGTACFITDKSLISLSTNCVKLRGIRLSLYDGGQHYVTEDGIDFVVRNSPNLTSLSLNCRSLQPSAFSFTIENPFTHAKNLHSLTMFQELVTDERICSVAKARPPLKKLKLVGFVGQYHDIHGALKLLLQACQLTLEELTLRSLCRGDMAITELAQYLSNLTSIELDENFGLTSVTFYTLTKYCPLLEKLVMARPRQQVMDTSSPEYFHRNYRMRHLDICYNMWLNDTKLENFGHICPNLQFLYVSNCLHLTNVGIGEVLRRCPAITKLNINGLKVSGLFARYSDDHSVLNLKTLNARWTEIDDKGMAMIGNSCRNLQYLDIECCNEVTDRGAMEVVKNCERLSASTKKVNLNAAGRERMCGYGGKD
ncbi:hypothetical protein RHMOL_Rhmol01G0026000 [Rhododendron molle]|uniref:Uncharacterized protein n=1 Tax=Rhododendron molle TaxID=49168 RepID=A0ACC0PYV6_RHOML|nr:hypothetical protein RHMOL_Rhmol01G0026000 [Rhododendron molle]